MSKPLLEVTPAELDTWQAGLRVSFSSISTYTSHIHSFYAWAVDTGRIDADPSKDLANPKVPERMPRPIPEKDLRDAIVTAGYDQQLLCWLLLAGFCGLRAGEISLVGREDFTIDQANGGAFLLVHGKGGRERVVRVPVEVMEVVSQFLHRTGAIFRRPGGTQFRPEDVSRISSEHIKGIGLPYTLHTLRHRFATAMCDLGADVRDVQRALGHASLATTTLYVAHDARRSSETVDRLGEGLRVMNRRQAIQGRGALPSDA